MANGEGMPPLEWLIAGFIGIGTAVFGFWNKVLHGRLNRHSGELKEQSRQLAKLCQFCDTQKDTNREIKEGFQKLHEKLDRWAEHGSFERN